MSNRAGMTAFVPQGENRQETAVLLLATAEEHGLDPRSVFGTKGGFYISDALADILDAPEAEEPDPAPKKAPKKTSGNRAAKKTTNEEK